MDGIAEIFDCEPGKSYPACVPKQVLRILESSPTGIVALDAGCRIIYINSQANRMLGASPRWAMGKPVTFFIEEPRFVDWLVSGLPESPPPFPWGRESIMISASRQGSPDDPRGYILFFQPADAFEGIDERVNRLQKELSLVLENSYDGIILADAETILNVNASFGRITGIAPSAVAGKKIDDLATERHICLAAISEIIRLTRFHRKTLTLQRRLTSGNEIFLTGTPVPDRHGQIVREVVNIRDITELKRLEDQIKKITTICPDPENGDAGEEEKAFQGIVAESPSMRRLLDMVLRVSRVDSTVLFQGESGVGKDVLARLVHRLSERRECPFVSVNCGAVPESLLESEFFGYEKGAFTSAARNGKAGLFEQANGGALFLDEVGELPLNLQVKLLKALQDRRCRRLGGTRNIDLDVRIIAATNRELRKMVSEGNFRMDLFYRLHVVPIEIAPLRDRREDILPLALMFLKHFNRKYNVSRTLGHELMSVLEDHDWPGNVRELQNMVERLVVTADEDALSVKHLPSSITKGAGLGAPAFRLPGSLNLKDAREAVEREVIREAMARSENTRQAAKLLGVDHSTVARKAKRYGIDLRAVAAAGGPDKARK